MTVTLVNLGTGPDTAGADTLYAAFTKVNTSLSALDAGGGSGGAAASAPSVISATTYTLQATDAGKTLCFTATAAVTVTVPTGLGASFQAALVQLGTGQVTISPGSGVTIHNYDTQFKIAGQYASVSLLATNNGTNDLLLVGRTAA